LDFKCRRFTSEFKSQVAREVEARKSPAKAESFIKALK
jgi:hypothetical protein